MNEFKLPTPLAALKQFFRYPPPPGENATPEVVKSYHDRVAEIDARIAALSDPKADQITVKAIKSDLIRRG